MFLNEKIIIKLKLLLKRWYEEMSDIWFKIAIKKKKTNCSYLFSLYVLKKLPCCLMYT